MRDGIRSLVEEIVRGGRALPRSWGRRDVWQVGLRWWVPPAILAGVMAGRSAGYQFETAPILVVAGLVLLYNAAFSRFFSRMVSRPDEEIPVDRRFSILQVSLDYAAMFVLIHYTGGASSPLIFFFILHVIVAAILFRPADAWAFAAAASLGMGGLALAEIRGWVGVHPLFFRGQALDLAERPGHTLATLIFFAASVLVTAALSTAIMRRLRERVANLARTTREVAELNEKLNSLYAMLRAVGSENRLDSVLRIVTSELAGVMAVPVVTVKLLSQDRERLRYAAAHGLPSDFTSQKLVEVARSPLNRRIIEGETLVFGEVTEDQTFQLQDDLLRFGIRSVVFVPLTLQDRVIGILGAYSREREHFSADDTSFFRLAAELVAIAIENARAYESVQELMRERSRFMLHVAHNMRAPLSATISMLDVVRQGYLGDVDPQQAEHLRRMDRRLRTLNTTVGQLLTLARHREGMTEMTTSRVAPKFLGDRLGRTFGDEAARKGLSFVVEAPEELAELSGDPVMLEQMLENLISNAIKYTPEGGRVEVLFGSAAPGWLRIEVRDTGIGVPAAEQARLFGEFFRASNAKAIEEDGTGLGLAIVKQIVERHEGRIQVSSQEGQGTSFVVELPVAPEEDQ